MIPPSIRAHRIWAKLRPFVAIEWAEKPTEKCKGRFRLELRGIPEDLAREALSAVVACADCGRAIHPVRHRKPPGNKRSESVGQGLFIGVACRLETNIVCSRGHAARDEYQAIRAEVERDHSHRSST